MMFCAVILSVTKNLLEVDQRQHSPLYHGVHFCNPQTRRKTLLSRHRAPYGATPQIPSWAVGVFPSIHFSYVNGWMEKPI